MKLNVSVAGLAYLVFLGACSASDGSSTGGLTDGGSGTGGSGATGGSGTGGSGATGTGGTGATGTGGGTGCPAGPVGAQCQQIGTGNATCDTCMQTNCCNETNACFADTGCAGFNQCLTDNCASASDIQQCAQTACAACLTQPVVDLFNAVGACVQANCATECG
ncbi:MAG: hypothetical protein IT376_05720 [Polyangiaceae bacterium]|nr:hypothetical protein [Polyangiaceae bacterium]